MERSAPVDGFSLAYERHLGDAQAAPVVLLHGWPGDREDWREVVPRLLEDGAAEVIVPDLRGFGASDKRAGEPAEAYAGAGQAASVLGLLRELGLPAAVIAAYDIGSRIAQQMARVAPAAVRAYLEHFWQHWSGPGYTPDPAQLDRLAAVYGTSGAFTASIGWYRAGSGTVARSLAEQTPAPEDRIAVPTTVLWPGHDPLFPRDWSDRIEAFFSAATVKSLPEAGHFTPLEAPAEFAGAILAALQDG